MRIFASHNPDEEIRHLSSSGGIFSMLAEQMLKEGGVVYGAAFNEHWQVGHRRVDNIADLAALRGSKYVYSNVGEAYTQAMEDLKAGKKVLFSGCPCQIAAMRKRAGENPNLLLVEAVCHGAPEPRYWDRYLDEQCQSLGKTRKDIESIFFRDKRTGWKRYSFTIRFNDGKEYSVFHGENPYLKAFLKNLTLREACFRCPFKYPDGTKADITIGDFWGIAVTAPEIDNNLGTTVVIARTPKGEEATYFLPNLQDLNLKDASTKNSAFLQAPTCNPKSERFQILCAKNSFCEAVISCTKELLKIRLLTPLVKIRNKLLACNR